MTPADRISALLLLGPALVLLPLPWLLRSRRPGMGGGRGWLLSLGAVALVAVVELALFDPLARFAARFRADSVMVSYHVIFGLLLAAVAVSLSALLAALVRTRR